jgi:hypothetical protein
MAEAANVGRGEDNERRMAAVESSCGKIILALLFE